MSLSLYSLKINRNLNTTEVVYTTAASATKLVVDSNNPDSMRRKLMGVMTKASQETSLEILGVEFFTEGLTQLVELEIRGTDVTNYTLNTLCVELPGQLFDFDEDFATVDWLTTKPEEQEHIMLATAEHGCFWEVDANG